MAAQGFRPTLVGAVGPDFDDYRSWLERHGVDTGSVHVSTLHHTARFLCTTDADQNQIASFYAGAMSEARLIELLPVAERLGGLDLVVIGANDPDAMLRHTDECRERGYPFVADPSQQLARMDGPQIRQLIDNPNYQFLFNTPDHNNDKVTSKDAIASLKDWVDADDQQTGFDPTILSGSPFVP